MPNTRVNIRYQRNIPRLDLPTPDLPGHLDHPVRIRGIVEKVRLLIWIIIKVIHFKLFVMQFF